MSRIPGAGIHSMQHEDIGQEFSEPALRYLTMQREMHKRWGVRSVVHISRRRKMLNFFKTLFSDIREVKRILTMDAADHDGAAGHHGWEK